MGFVRLSVLIGAFDQFAPFAPYKEDAKKNDDENGDGRRN